MFFPRAWDVRVAVAVMVGICSLARAQTIWIAEESQGADGRAYAARPLGRVEGAVAVAVPEAGERVLVLTAEGRVREWRRGSEWHAVDAARDVIAVAAGSEHTLALRPDGTVLAWGQGGDGQLGNGQLTSSVQPRAVDGLNRVKAIAAGANYSIALGEDGRVYAWGSNWQSIAPQHGERLITRPVTVGGVPLMRAVLVRGNQPFAMDQQGRVWTWGKFPLMVRDPSPRIVSTGDDVLSRQAIESVERDLRDERAAAELVGPRWWPASDQRDRILNPAGAHRVSDGVVLVQFADETLQFPATGWTRRIAAGAGWAIVWIEVEERSTLATKAVGDNVSAHAIIPAVTGTLEAMDADASPRAPAQAIAIGAGAKHSLMAKSDGGVWGWGDSTDGQAGVPYRSTPFPIPGIGGVSSVAGGENHSLALKTDGTVWAWGANDLGQVGTDAGTSQQNTPRQVTALSDITRIAAGGSHNLAIQYSGKVPGSVDGKVYAWGWNSWGQLGDGTNTTRTTPVPVTGLTQVAGVAAGALHSLAVRGDGTVWAWGNNTNGQLGDGTTTSRQTPVRVAGLIDVAAVAAGDTHSVAVKRDGTVWAWGHNTSGQLGDGSHTDRLTPVRVGTLTGMTAVAAGSTHSMALRNDGTVWTWGDNSYRQIGDDSLINRSTPGQMPSLSGVAAIAAGGWHSLALKSDGTLWAWGRNNELQLGTGSCCDNQTLSPVFLYEFGEASAIVGAGGGSGSVAIVVSPPSAAWSVQPSGFLSVKSPIGVGSAALTYTY